MATQNAIDLNQQGVPYYDGNSTFTGITGAQGTVLAAAGVTNPPAYSTTITGTGIFDFTDSIAGDVRSLRVSQTDTTNTNSSSVLWSKVATGGGYPSVLLDRGGVSFWQLGMNTSSSDTFAISHNNNFLNTYFTISTSGTIAFPQAAFTTDGILFSGASGNLLTTAAGTSGQLLQSKGGGGTAPAFTTATYPATTTANQILYSSSANTVAGLATANTAVVLTNGSGVPSLTNAAAAGSSWILVQYQTVSNVASVSFTTGINAGILCFVFDGVRPNTNGSDIHMLVSTNGGSTYNNTGYTSGINVNQYNTATLTNSNATTFFYICVNGSNTNFGTIGQLFVNTNASQTLINGDLSYVVNGTDVAFAAITGRSSSGSVNAFQFLASAGNITGNIALYQLRTA